MNFWTKLIRKLADGSIVESVRFRLRRAWMAVLRASGRTHLDASLENGRLFRIYFDSKLCQWIYLGQFEVAERAFLRAYLRLGDVFYDVGANYGLFSVLAADRVGREGSVEAFELLPSVLERLTANVQINKLSQVRIHPVGWSDATAERSMVVSNQGFDAWASLTTDSVSDGDSSEPVRLVSCDGYMSAQQLRHPALVKLDVEGWELHALRGATRLTQPGSPTDWLIEFSRMEREGYADYTERLFAHLSDLGYQLFRLDRAPATLQRLSVAPPEAYVNVVATRDVAALLARLPGYRLID